MYCIRYTTRNQHIDRPEIQIVPGRSALGIESTTVCTGDRSPNYAMVEQRLRIDNRTEKMLLWNRFAGGRWPPAGSLRVSCLFWEGCVSAKVVLFARVPRLFSAHGDGGRRNTAFGRLVVPLGLFAMKHADHNILWRADKCLSVDGIEGTRFPAVHPGESRFVCLYRKRIEKDTQPTLMAVSIMVRRVNPSSEKVSPI